MAEEAEDQTEGEETPEGEEEGQKKGGLMKLIIFVGLPALIVILGGVAGALFFLGGGEEQVVEVADGEYAEGAEGYGEGSSDPEADADAYFDYLDKREFSMTVNIPSSNGRSLTMMIEFAIVFTDSKVGYELDDELVQLRMRDTLNEFMRTLREEDLDGSMGNFRMRAEMLRRANLVLAPYSAEEVLILGLIMG